MRPIEWVPYPIIRPVVLARRRRESRWNEEVLRDDLAKGQQENKEKGLQKVIYSNLILNF